MTVRNIVFVDDDNEDSEFFSTAMQQVQPAIQISLASTATEMYRSLDKQVPDLLFIDSFLQEQSGPDNIKTIRKKPGCEALPVIMYTGSADQRSITRAFEAGANVYLVKPNSLKEIKAMMQELLDIVASGQLASLHGMCYIDGKFQRNESSNKTG